MFRKILVLCTANICRSPMAAAVLRDRLTNPDIEVASAGLEALVGHPIDPIARSVIEDRGLPVEPHQARRVDRQLVRESDVIFVMEGVQRYALCGRYPGARAKTYRIGLWGEYDVPDPYRRPRPAYEEAMRLIERGVEDWLQVLFRDSH